MLTLYPFLVCICLFADLVGWPHQTGLQPGSVEWLGDNVPAEGSHKTLSAGGQERTYSSEKVIATVIVEVTPTSNFDPYSDSVSNSNCDPEPESESGSLLELGVKI